MKQWVCKEISIVEDLQTELNAFSEQGYEIFKINFNERIGSHTIIAFKENDTKK